jgi:hypothetical protein
MPYRLSSPGSMVARRQLEARSAAPCGQGPEEAVPLSSDSEDDVIPVNIANPQEVYPLLGFPCGYRRP